MHLLQQLIKFKDFKDINLHNYAANVNNAKQLSKRKTCASIIFTDNPKSSARNRLLLKRTTHGLEILKKTEENYVLSLSTLN